MGAKTATAEDRGRHARSAGVVTASVMILAPIVLCPAVVDGIAGLLDAERRLALSAYLVANAIVLWLFAQRRVLPTFRFGAKLASYYTGMAVIDAAAVAFAMVNGIIALGALIHAAPSPAVWLGLIPAGATFWVFAEGRTANVPLNDDALMNEALTDVALILTGAPPERLSWRAVLTVAAYYALTRIPAFAIVVTAMIAGYLALEWLETVVYGHGPLTIQTLLDSGPHAVVLAREMTGRASFWAIFALVALAPSIFVLAVGAWEIATRRGRREIAITYWSAYGPWYAYPGKRAVAATSATPPAQTKAQHAASR
jgi:hypothetical protein